MSILVPMDSNGDPLVITPPTGYVKLKDVEGCLTSGAVHNSAETKILGTDDDMLASDFFSDDGLVFVERDWAEVLAFIWGNTNTWGRFGLDKYGSCALFELNQYLFALEYTVAVYNRFAAYYKQCDESGGIIPYV